MNEGSQRVQASGYNVSSGHPVCGVVTTATNIALCIRKLLKEKLPRSVGAQYATGDQWRNNSRKNEGMEPKQKQQPVVNGTGDRSKIRYCKEQYCIGTRNVRSMN